MKATRSDEQICWHWKEEWHGRQHYTRFQKLQKKLNKITTKHTQNPTNEERQKLKTLQNLKGKLKNNNIIHVKANKGNGLVLINKNEYINKTLEFI